MAKQVIDYIRQPDVMDNQSLDHLINVVEKYPYYHAARIMMLRTMYQLHDNRFDRQLKLAAAYLPSRATLFQMFESQHVKPDNPGKRQSHAQSAAENSAGERTEVLIDDFLNTMPEESHQQQPRVIDATTDYMAYLMQQEGMNAGTVDSGDYGIPEKQESGDLIDQFLNENQGHFELHDDPEAPVLEPEPQNAENYAPSGILTEAMAHIYIKQGKYDKAIEILRRISLKNPKKNRYFADQIRFLGKLIINQKALERSQLTIHNA